LLQIITFGPFRLGAWLRDVGRVLEFRYGRFDNLSSCCPQNPARGDAAKAIDGEPKLQADATANPVVKRAFDIALKLEGLYRTPRPTPRAS